MPKPRGTRFAPVREWRLGVLFCSSRCSGGTRHGALVPGRDFWPDLNQSSSLDIKRSMGGDNNEKESLKVYGAIYEVSSRISIYMLAMHIALRRLRLKVVLAVLAPTTCAQRWSHTFHNAKKRRQACVLSMLTVISRTTQN